MISKNTEKIILFLLKNINEFGYNINQISKMNNISVGSVFKILKGLEKNDILSKKKISNALFYNLNFNNNETIKLCELLILREKRNLKSYAKIYGDDISKFKSAEIIILFGSILNNSNFNDVDVLFVTTNVKRASDFCLDISKIKTKPVVPLILKRNDLIKELKEGKESIVNIIRNGIVLKGEDLFVKLIKDVNL